MRTWTPEMREVFASALAGLYKRTGVHVVREQVIELFENEALWLDAIPEGLTIGRRFFAYDDGPDLIAADQSVTASNVVFSRQPLAWKDWSARVNKFLTELHALMWPDLFVLGGGVVKKADKFLHYLDPGCEVRPAALGNNAGIVGAALVALGAVSTSGV